jgi:hypothetical protein
MFKYLLIGIIAYWIMKRVFRINNAVRNNEPQKPNQTPKQEDKHGGDYVDYEEVE